MIQIPGRIPLSIHPFFWLLAAFIGWMNSQSFVGMMIWIGIIVISVLIHEYGHALTAVCFKQKAQIQLMALGGLTSYTGPKLTFKQQFLIVFNGPLFGFFICLIATALLRIDLSQTPILFTILKWTQVANLFWTIVNLLPVMPLDGGQLLRIVLESIFGVGGFKASLLIGAIIAILISLCFFLLQGLLIGALFFLFAFQSFDTWRKYRIAVKSDREDANNQMLIAGETALQEGNKQLAKELFEKVREKTKGKGVLGVAAAQSLAILHMQQGEHKEAYDLLVPIEPHLNPEVKCMLHQLAMEFKNYEIVASLSAECYQIQPSQEMALRSARAFAYLKQPKHAGGWLQTALSYGHLDLAKLLHEEVFAALRGNPEFEHFIPPT